MQASTWTNATATVNDKVVTVTPTEGTLDIFAVISNTCGFTGVTVYYVEDNTPTIIANNVEIAYDATYGEVPFTLNATGFPGELSVSDNVDWIYDAYPTLDLTKVTFHSTVNEAANPREGIITITFVYNRETVSKSVTVTQAGNPNAVNSISEITDAGDYIVQGTIVAKSQRGFIVGDGTGYVYYYNQNYTQADYNIGDLVRLDGPVVVYNGVFEFNSSTTVTAAESSNYMTEDPTVLSGADMDARVASATPAQLSSYVQYEGTLSVNNSHYNITNIDGATTAFGSISYPLNSDEITALNGKQVIVKGYYVGISSSQYYNTMIGSVEEIEVPHEQYTLTVSNLVNVNTFVFDAANQNETLLEGEGSVQIYDGTGVMISVDVEEGFALQSLMVDSVNVTSQIDETGAYTFFMPTHNVTVTATAVEIIAPTGGDYVRISSLDQLTDGSIVVIASRYDSIATNYFAMKNTITNGKAQGEAFVSTTSNGNEILPAAIVEDENDYYWVVNVTEDGYTFTNANGDVISYNSSTNFNMNGNKTTWSIAIDTSGAALVPYYEGFVITNTTTTNRGIALRDNDGNKVFVAYSTTNMNGDTYNYFLDFFVQTEATQTVTQTIALSAGTNWISSYVEVELTDLQTALTDVLGTTGISITIQSQTDNCILKRGRWTGDLTEMDLAQMYQIDVPSDCEITLEGMPIDPAMDTLNISFGENWIAFPFTQNMSLPDAFAGLAATNDIVSSQTVNAQYKRGRWTGDLSTLEPGQGYIYSSVTNGTQPFVYPTANKSAKGGAKPATMGPRKAEILSNFKKMK